MDEVVIENSELVQDEVIKSRKMNGKKLAVVFASLGVILMVCALVWQMTVPSSINQITTQAPVSTYAHTTPTPTLRIQLDTELQSLEPIPNSIYAVYITVSEGVETLNVLNKETNEKRLYELDLPSSVSTDPVMYPRSAISTQIADRYLLVGFEHNFAVVFDLVNQNIVRVVPLSDFTAMFGRKNLHPSQSVVVYTTKFEGPESVTDAFVLSDSGAEHTRLLETSIFTQHNSIFGIETLSVTPKGFLLRLSRTEESGALPKPEEEYLSANTVEAIRTNEIEAEAFVNQSGIYQQVKCNLDPSTIGQGSTYGCYGLISVQEVPIEVGQPIRVITPAFGR